MRRYDDPVEVRKGLVPGAGGQVEGPEQFLWRGRLWKVCDVVGHWVETGPWWQAGSLQPASVHDLVADREVWRVEAARGRAAAGAGPDPGRGVFDLVFDWGQGGWQLSRCAD